jgi:hypothetical protein
MHFGILDPILVTGVRINRNELYIHCTVVWDHFAAPCSHGIAHHPVDVGIQDILPPLTTPTSCSTWNQRGNCGPILYTVHLDRILQVVHLPIRPAVKVMLGFKASCHLLRYCCCVRPGTSAAIAPQFLPSCVCTAAFSMLSSSSLHVPVRSFSRSMLGSNASRHLHRHCVCVRPGTNADCC